MKMEFDWAEGDLDSSRRDTAGHVTSLIYQNLSQTVKILNTGIMQN